MNKEERKEKIAELRKYHEGILSTIKDAYFACKHAHYPDDMPDEKCIGLFASEISKGDDVYLEFVTMDYTPSDSTRRLYVWKHQSDYVTRYKQNKKTGQYLIPVTELHVVGQTFDINDPKQAKELELLKAAHTIPATVFEKKETSEAHFKEETYVSTDGSKHRIEYKNGLPNEYEYSPKDESEHKLGFILRAKGQSLQEVFNFIKQLKY